MSTPPELRRTILGVATLIAAALALPACAPASTPASGPFSETPADGSTDRPHGYVAGASEMPEAQLHLVSIDGEGAVTLLDLLDEQSETMATLDAPPTSVSTDGRFVFASSAATGDLTIMDSGAWTVDHEDHVHYYSAEPRPVGTIAESADAGEAVVAGGPSLTGVWFGGTGVGMLLDTEALGHGEIVETARVEAAPHVGALVPFGEGALATIAGDDGRAAGVRLIDSEGDTVEGSDAECAELDGSITTNVGVVFGCADGALLVTIDGDGGSDFERIPYPQEVSVSERAAGFDNRRGRPVAAAVAGDRGAWLLDTRARQWTFLPTEAPLLRVTAASDADDSVVALADDGRVLLLDAATGATRAATLPLAASSLADPALASGVTLQLDVDRVYLNAPADGAVYEIDYRDGLRVARTLSVGAQRSFLAETGR